MKKERKGKTNGRNEDITIENVRNNENNKMFERKKEKKS